MNLAFPILLSPSSGQESKVAKEGEGGDFCNLSGQNSYPDCTISPAQMLQLSAEAPAVFLTRQIMLMMSDSFLKQKWNVRRWKHMTIGRCFSLFGERYYITHSSGFPQVFENPHSSTILHETRQLPLWALGYLTGLSCKSLKRENDSWLKRKSNSLN